MGHKLRVVTASTDLTRAVNCLQSWGKVPIHAVLNGGRDLDEETRFSLPTLTIDRSREYLGVVPAFRRGVNHLLETTDAEIIACLHDDVRIDDPRWVERVEEAFRANPKIGLLGFGGAIGVGADDIYQTEYQPMQLARIGFRSNLTNAEDHGIRSLRRERVACLDGFSLIGRRDFFLGRSGPQYFQGVECYPEFQPWNVLAHLGVIHHAYDGMLGCLAARMGWETWYLPIPCHHYGGQTAVGDRDYQAWAETQVSGGDHGFWQEAHRIWYDNFRDVLPLRVDGDRR